MRALIAFLVAAAAAAAMPSPAHAEELAPPIARTPAKPIGTVVLLPGSAWKAASLAAQQRVWNNAAPSLYDAGYRVVAIDVPAGPVAGLAAARKVVNEERRRLRRGPLCLYGESSGGHLALLLANRMRAVSCVITFGTPTSFVAYAEAAAAQPEQPGYQFALEESVIPTFGSDPAEWAPWEPASIRTPVRIPVLMMICADDPIVPVDQIYHVPGAKTYIPPRGDPADPEDRYVHGTVSDAGREDIRRRILAFLGAVPERRLSARRS